MTATTTTVLPAAPAGSRNLRAMLGSRIGMWAVLLGLAILSLARVIADAPDLTSSGTFGVAVRTGMPIAMAGLAGLYAERSGTVNIGLEGMMVMGTIFAGWWGWYWNPWMAIVGGIVGGMLGGLLHAVATVKFGVNHIVSGVAINLIAPGVARFMANELFTGQPGGSVSNSPGNNGELPHFTMPFISGGRLLGWDTWDPLGNLENREWFLISDIAGIIRGLTRDLTFDIVIAAVLIILSWYVLWRTPFGLRLRSSGEKPSAPDSLGVSVAAMRYWGMLLSGAMAGFGGTILVLFANRYQQDQTGGRGFLGLATLIFGNWRPSGLAGGAGLFGYASGITLRAGAPPEALVRALLLAGAMALLVAVAWSIATRKITVLIVALLLSALAFWAYVVFKEPSNQFVYIFPYVVTLAVVSARSQSLRPPAAAGIPYFKGQQG